MNRAEELSGRDEPRRRADVDVVVYCDGRTRVKPGRVGCTRMRRQA